MQREAFERNINHLTQTNLQWHGFARLLIIGNQLVKHLGIENLRKAQSFAKWERPNSLFLFSSPNNLYHFDGRSKTIALSDYDYDVILMEDSRTIDVILMEDSRTIFESEDVYNKHFYYRIDTGVSPVYSVSNLIKFDIELTPEKEGY